MLRTIGKANINFEELLADLEALRAAEAKEKGNGRENASIWRALYGWIESNCGGNQRDDDGKPT